MVAHTVDRVSVSSKSDIRMCLARTLDPGPLCRGKRSLSTMFTPPPPFWDAMADADVVDLVDAATQPDDPVEEAEAWNRVEPTTPIRPRRPGSTASSPASAGVAAVPRVSAQDDLRPLSERLQGMSPGSSARVERPADTPARDPPRPPRSAEQAPPLAGSDASFGSSWTSWLRRYEESSGEYVDPDLTDQVMALPLPEARKVLASISQARVDRPIGLLIWTLRNYAANGSGASSLPRERGTPNRTNAQAGDPKLSSKPSPAAKGLGNGLALKRAAVGEAATFESDQLHCMSCGRTSEYGRRLCRAGGTSQPLTAHRFVKCICGGRTSIQESEHFQGLYHIQVAVPRCQSTSTAAGDSVSGVPHPVTPADVNFAVDANNPADCLKCAACAQALTLVLYDKSPHVFQTVEYSCGQCQEVYTGFIAVGNRTTSCSLMRRRA